MARASLSSAAQVPGFSLLPSHTLASSFSLLRLQSPALPPTDLPPPSRPPDAVPSRPSTPERPSKPIRPATERSKGVLIADERHDRTLSVKVEVRDIALPSEAEVLGNVSAAQFQICYSCILWRQLKNPTQVLRNFSNTYHAYYDCQ